jgi:hypothetical protein
VCRKGENRLRSCTVLWSLYSVHSATFFPSGLVSDFLILPEKIRSYSANVERMTANTTVTLRERRKRVGFIDGLRFRNNVRLSASLVGSAKGHF